MELENEVVMLDHVLGMFNNMDSMLKRIKNNISDKDIMVQYEFISPISEMIKEALFDTLNENDEFLNNK